MRGRAVRLLPVLVVGAAVWAFANGLGGAFLWDDGRSIVENPHVHRLGLTTFTRTSRPLVQLTFALDHAVAGLDSRRYHVDNLAIHVLAALLLYTLVRRCLARAQAEPSQAASALWLAGTIAALWAVHPLQTESVTYVVERSESMAGLFGLLVLYALDRAAWSASGRGWTTVAILSSLCAIASKPVAIAIPLVALLYDRTVLSGSFHEALRRRWLLGGRPTEAPQELLAVLALDPGHTLARRSLERMAP